MAEFLFWRASIKAEAKKLMLKCLWNKRLIFQHSDMLNYYWGSEFKRFVVGKLGALKITKILKSEIKYLFRQSLASPNKQHTHSIFWTKYIFLNIFSTLAQPIQQDSSIPPMEEGKYWGCPTFWSRLHKLISTFTNLLYVWLGATFIQESNMKTFFCFWAKEKEMGDSITSLESSM